MTIYDNELQRKLTDLMIELEDKKALRLISYPSEVASWLVNHDVCIRGITTPWIRFDPVNYYPTWAIYKTIANGFSWKGRKHKNG